MTNEELMDWLHNPENIGACEGCIYNVNNTASRYPCGQGSCWVEVHCDLDSEPDEDEE